MKRTSVITSTPTSKTVSTTATPKSGGAVSAGINASASPIMSPSPKMSSSSVFTIGDFVSVSINGNTVSAQVKYAGAIIGFDSSDIWLGLEFPEPVGKCDGKVRVTKDG